MRANTARTAVAYTRHFCSLSVVVVVDADDEILYRVVPAYSDMTYMPSGENRPNPRSISNAIFKGSSGLPSYDNKTVMFAYFGETAVRPYAVETELCFTCSCGISM